MVTKVADPIKKNNGVRAKYFSSEFRGGHISAFLSGKNPNECSLKRKPL
jgi:hypothetical protein